jgi:chromosome segregation ATPase
MTYLQPVYDALEKVASDLLDSPNYKAAYDELKTEADKMRVELNQYWSAVEYYKKEIEGKRYALLDAQHDAYSEKERNKKLTSVNTELQRRVEELGGENARLSEQLEVLVGKHKTLNTQYTEVYRRYTQITVSLEQEMKTKAY